MALTTREVAVLGILLCCVPFQLWLSKLSSLTHEEKSIKVQEILISNKLYLQSFFSPSLWIVWLKDSYKNIFVKDYSRWYPDSKDPVGECPAVEVLKHRFPNGHFATSVVPRDFRPKEVKYRVGQVVRHLKYNYVGIIIGWDRTSKAPDTWIKQMHGDNHMWRLQPNYAVLVDVRNRPNPQITYVVQENIEIVKKEVLHPDIKKYFDFYDGSQYLAQSWLRAMYPMD